MSGRSGAASRGKSPRSSLLSSSSQSSIQDRCPRSFLSLDGYFPGFWVCTVRACCHDVFLFGREQCCFQVSAWSSLGSSVLAGCTRGWSCLWPGLEKSWQDPQGPQEVSLGECGYLLGGVDAQGDHPTPAVGKALPVTTQARLRFVLQHQPQAWPLPEAWMSTGRRFALWLGRAGKSGGVLPGHGPPKGVQPTGDRRDPACAFTQIPHPAQALYSFLAPHTSHLSSSLISQPPRAECLEVPDQSSWREGPCCGGPRQLLSSLSPPFLLGVSFSVLPQSYCLAFSSPSPFWGVLSLSLSLLHSANTGCWLYAGDTEMYGTCPCWSSESTGGHRCVNRQAHSGVVSAGAAACKKRQWTTEEGVSPSTGANQGRLHRGGDISPGA